MATTLHQLRLAVARKLLPGAGPHVDEILRALPAIAGLEQLLDFVCAAFAEMLDASVVCLFLHEPITGRFICRRTFGLDLITASAMQFDRSHPVVRWMAINGTAIDLSGGPGTSHGLKPADLTLPDFAQRGLIAPLVTAGYLCGLVVISPRKSAAPFSDDDISALTNVAGHAALAIEYALIHGQQEQRLSHMLQADRLASIGQLAAGAAHEIRNPLAAIRSAVQYLGRHVPAGEQGLISTVIHESDRIDGIIKGLLSLSRSSDLELTSLDIGAMVAKVLDLLDPQLRKADITLSATGRLHHPVIEADGARIRQVLLNVILNAIQAMPGGGSLSVALADAVMNEQGDAVRISVTDTGPGIPPVDLPKVFEPFFTTKESGTGLGLSICYGIVTRHQGEISIDSCTTGESPHTTVTITLPCRQSLPVTELI